MYRISALLCLLASLSACSAESVKFLDCGSTGAKIQSVNVTPCPGAPQGCLLKKGTSPEISVTFVPNSEVTSVKAKVFGILGGAKVPFPLPNPDGCNKSGLTCPIAANSKNTYAQKLEVKSIYPTVRVVVEWHLQDQSGKDLVCFRMQAKVSD